MLRLNAFMAPTKQQKLTITSTLAKKLGLSSSKVAITLQFLIASGKILKQAREGDTDSLVFPKENEKRPEKVSTKKKLLEKGIPYR